MKDTAGNNNKCCCSQSPVKKTARAIPPFLISVLFAFFPKCPVCWAVYMSMFGSVGLARLPYMRWLLPVLLLLLIFHLFLIYRKIPQKGYIPFLLSFAGAGVILCGRALFPAGNWLLLSGMALIIAGSLVNSFSRDRLSYIESKTNHQ